MRNPLVITETRGLSGGYVLILVELDMRGDDAGFSASPPLDFGSHPAQNVGDF